MKNNEVNIDVDVNTEKIDEAIEKAEELGDILPRIIKGRCSFDYKSL